MSSLARGLLHWVRPCLRALLEQRCRDASEDQNRQKRGASTEVRIMARRLSPWAMGLKTAPPHPLRHCAGRP